MALGKGLKPRDTEGGSSRPSAEEMLRAAHEAGGPSVPPTQMPAIQVSSPPPAAPMAAPPAQGSTGAFAFRMRNATLSSLAEVARSQGMTQKQIVCLGLQKMGVDVASVDLEDRTPRRGR